MSDYKPQWHRANLLPSMLGTMALLFICLKFFDDEIVKEVGVFDMAVLWFIRQNTPLEMTGFFTLITSTGAAIYLVPATVVITATFFVFTHKREACLIAATMACAAVATYAIKALVNRGRPDLCNATSYAISSFPSVHTLCTTALAMALALCVPRLWPMSRCIALAPAALWAGLMALSRLVLGAHRPTYVLAAVVLGVFIASAISAYRDHHSPRWVVYKFS